MKKVILVLLLLLCAFSFATAEGDKPYAVKEFSLSGRTASFTVYAESDCQLVVKVYNGSSAALEDPEPTLVKTLRKDVTSDDSSEGIPVSVTLPDSPEYFYLEWYLESAAGSKLTEEYQSARYCEDIVGVANAESDTLRAEYGKVVIWQKAEGTYSYGQDGSAVASAFNGGSVKNFVALNDDVLVVGTDDEEYESPVDGFTLSESGLTMTLSAPETLITDIEGLRYKYVFHGTAGIFNVRKIDDISVAGDGKSATLKLSADEVKLQDYCQAARVVGSAKQLDPFPINLGLGAVKATGTLNSSVDCEFYYKFSLFHPVVDIKFLYNYSVDDFKITIKEAVSLEKTIVPIPILEPIPGVGFDSNLKFVLEAQVTGEIDMKISGAMGMQFGLDGWKKPYGNDLSEGPHVTMDDWDLEGEVFTGFAIGPEFNIEGIFSFGGYVKLGPLFRAQANKVGYVDDGQVYHACEKGKCWGGSARFRFGLSLAYTVFGTPHSIWEKNWDTDPWAMWYKSNTFGDGAWGDYCPHRAYRLNVHVKDTRGNPVDGVTVTYNPSSGSEFDSVSTAVTKNGTATVYISRLDGKGGYKNKVTVRAEFEDKDMKVTLAAEKEFTEEGYGDINLETGTLVCGDLDIVLDITKYKVSFFDNENGSGTPSNMPDPFTYYAALGGVIPQNIPLKTGRVFLGWSTNPKAVTPDDRYHPGSPVKGTADLNLYAVWTQPDPDFYVVVYNPNGGTGAPPAEICQADEDCVISDVIPVKEKCTFLGWGTSTEWDDDLKVYHGGDVYKERRTLLLYALWQVEPVYAARLTYDVNGGDPATAPADQYVVADAYSYLTKNVPSWDDKHAFTGWSLSPKSLHANYYPGSLAYIDGDTVFYAVWELDPYRIIEGGGSVWVRGSGESLRFRADGAYDLFRLLMIDGEPVSGSDYTASSGSTVVLLDPGYLDKLADGTHQIKFCYEDGDSDTAVFTVAEPDPTPSPTPSPTPAPTPSPTPMPKPPVTGDDGAPPVWMLGCLAALIGFVLLAFGRKSTRS